MKQIEPHRIEFLEYLKAEFIQWWEAKKGKKLQARKKKEQKRYEREMRQDLINLSGDDLFNFTAYIHNERNFIEVDKPTLIEIFKSFVFIEYNK